MIGIVDYRAGNLTSVARALTFLGIPWEITDDPAVLERARGIIFPGVGAAGEAMANLKEKGLDVCLREWFSRGKPILGICLGTQVIFGYSEEDDTPCLGIVPGMVKRFDHGLSIGGRPLKIPHMGWNNVEFVKKHPIFTGIPEGAEFYFVHSYYPVPQDETNVVGRTYYGKKFCSAVAVGNLVALQFHPEKSGRFGLRILSNFCRMAGEIC